MSYQRVQILLTPEQYRALKRMAQRRRESLSALVRALVQKGLEQEREDWVERTRRVTRALLEARGGKPIAFDAVELVRSLREERADALAPWTDAGRD